MAHDATQSVELYTSRNGEVTLEVTTSGGGSRLAQLTAARRPIRS